jgi:hypothetical protein
MNDWCGEPVAVFVLGHDCSGFRLCKNAKGRGEGLRSGGDVDIGIYLDVAQPVGVAAKSAHDDHL